MYKGFNEPLVMPSSYSIMDEEERLYVEGGTFQLVLSEGLKYKTGCNGMAKWLCETGRVTGMTQLEIAQEIYAHAMSYYYPDKMADTFGILPAIYCYYKGADGVTIEDGGDTAIRKEFYKMVWTHV